METLIRTSKRHILTCGTNDCCFYCMYVLFLPSTDTVGLVLSSCLRGLYSLTSKPEKKVTGSGGKGSPSSLPPSSKNLNQLYILVVCVLMLVQDSSVLQEIVKHEHEVPMDWYKERQLKHVRQSYAPHFNSRSSVIKIPFPFSFLSGLSIGRCAVVPAAHSDARSVPTAGPIPTLQCLRCIAQPVHPHAASCVALHRRTARPRALSALQQSREAPGK